jgi:multidrug efflux system membrane fusion protein
MVMINQVHPIFASFGVAEQFLPEIQQRQRVGALKVSASYAGMKGPVPAGELTFVDNTVDTTTGTIQLKATFANEDNVLWPGQFVTVAMTLRENPRAIVVPSQAVQLGQNGEFIYVVRPDKTVEARPVKTDFVADNETVVADGLKAGEIVVTDGQLRLEPGPTNTPPSAP